jgi:hypothetical protein
MVVRKRHLYSTLLYCAVLDFGHGYGDAHGFGGSENKE